VGTDRGTAPNALILDMDEAEYHAHPALSYSTGKEYLRSPAHYRHAVTHRKERSEFDFGHIVHALVLGVGMDFIAIPEDLLASNGAVSTKAAKEFVADARAAGIVPLKAEAIADANAAANAVLTHPEARRYLDLPGAAEVSLFATDPAFGVEVRGRVDWLPDARPGKRTFPVDLKTTSNASPAKVARTIVDYHYDVQAALYRRLIHLVRGDDVGPMVQIYVETDEPYGVSVVQLAHEDWIGVGDIKLNAILARHAECLRTNTWPGYPATTQILTPPGYYLAELDRIEVAA